MKKLYNETCNRNNLIFFLHFSFIYMEKYNIEFFFLSLISWHFISCSCIIHTLKWRPLWYISITLSMNICIQIRSILSVLDWCLILHIIREGKKSMYDVIYSMSKLWIFLLPFNAKQLVQKADQVYLLVYKKSSAVIRCNAMLSTDIHSWQYIFYFYSIQMHSFILRTILVHAHIFFFFFLSVFYISDSAESDKSKMRQF